MSGYDFIAIHDGGSWIWAGNNSAKHPLTGETVPAGDASATAGGLISGFAKKKGSYHYYIGLDGTIFHLISEKLGSYASGCWSQKMKTRWGKTIPTCAFIKANKRSISISLRNPGKGKGYTEEQHTSVRNLLQDISRRRGIPLDDNHVVAHFEVKKYNHFDPVSGGKAASGKDSKNWWNWVSLGSNFNYDHAKENYGNQYPHKVTG
jgi:N-acetyl-anhydromuramyl-L-alanine amidase AmpD